MAKIRRNCAPGNLPFPETEPRVKAPPAPAQETLPAIDQSEKKMLHGLEGAVIQAKVETSLPSSQQLSEEEKQKRIAEVLQKVKDMLRAKYQAGELSNSSVALNVAPVIEEPQIPQEKFQAGQPSESSVALDVAPAIEEPQASSPKPSLYKVKAPLTPPEDGFVIMAISPRPVVSITYTSSVEDTNFWKAVEINLRNHNISLKPGENPWDSNSLSQLRSLVLTSCELKHIPAQISRFTNVESLFLNGNPDLNLGAHVYKLPNLKAICVDEGVSIPIDVPKHLQIHYS